MKFHDPAEHQYIETIHVSGAIRHAFYVRR